MIGSLRILRGAGDWVSATGARMLSAMLLLPFVAASARAQTDVRAFIDAQYRVAGLPWGAPGAAVTERFRAFGFSPLDTTPHKDLRFTGFLYGRRATLWAYLQRDSLLRVTATFEPADGSVAAALADSLTNALGGPSRALADTALHWPASAASGDWRARIRDRSFADVVFLSVTAPGITAPIPRPTRSTGRSAYVAGIMQDLSPDFMTTVSAEMQIGAAVTLRAGPDRSARALRTLRPGDVYLIGDYAYRDDFRVVILPAERHPKRESWYIGYVHAPSAKLHDVTVPDTPPYGDMGPCAARARAVHRQRGRGPDEVTRYTDDGTVSVSWWYYRLRNRTSGRPVTLSVDFLWGRYTRGCKVSTFTHTGEP